MTDEQHPNRAANTALVLGLVSFMGGLTALPGFIFGVIGLRRAKHFGGEGKGTAVAGMILSVVGSLLVAGAWWRIFWSREAAVQMDTTNNFKQLGVAIQTYHDTHDHFPAPFAQNLELPFAPVPESELASKMSWRVAIVPYVEKGDIYHRMNLNEPWDSATNRPFAAIPFRSYMDPDTRDDPDTRYRVFYGPGTVWPLDRQVKITHFTDGTSNTILVVESGEKVMWTRFAEITFDPANPPNPAAMGRPNTAVFAAAMADGSVRSFRKTMNPQVLKAAITPNGGEVVNFDE